MAGVYIVQGKLGSGKGKYCVGKMAEALRAGQRVATNFDLKMEHLVGPNNKATAIRVPDKPTAQDLDDIGPGATEEDRYDEDRYGVLVLDELGSWLNSRQFADKGRAALLDWLIHARKKLWTVYLIVQDVNMIDKQVRQGLAEYLVKCIRADKLKIPVVGTMMGKRGRLPKFHVANITMSDVPGVVIDRDWFRNTDIQNGYDTLQVFRNWVRDPAEPGFETELYMGPFSYISAWHLKGRHEGAKIKRRGLFRAPPRAPLGPKPARLAALGNLPPDEAWAMARQMVAS